MGSKIVLVLRKRVKNVYTSKNDPGFVSSDLTFRVQAWKKAMFFVGKGFLYVKRLCVSFTFNIRLKVSKKFWQGKKDVFFTNFSCRWTHVLGIPLETHVHLKRRLITEFFPSDKNSNNKNIYVNKSFLLFALMKGLRDYY